MMLVPKLVLTLLALCFLSHAVIGKKLRSSTWTNCAPTNAMNFNTCKRQIAYCSTLGITMKWSGKGCKVDGTDSRDGGCQCDGYCGYSCQAACDNDPQCAWNPFIDGCLTKDGRPGLPITICDGATTAGAKANATHHKG